MKGHFTSWDQMIKEVIIEARGIAFVPKGRKYTKYHVKLNKRDLQGKGTCQEEYNNEKIEVHTK